MLLGRERTKTFLLLLHKSINYLINRGYKQAMSSWHAQNECTVLHEKLLSNHKAPLKLKPLLNGFSGKTEPRTNNSCNIDFKNKYSTVK